MTKEALLEMNPEKVKNLAEYIAYCKYYFKPKSEEKVRDYLYVIKGNKPVAINKNKVEKLLQDFPFLKTDKNYNKELTEEKWNGELFRYLKNHGSEGTFKDFPLSWLKENLFKEKVKVFEFINDKSLDKISRISGIFKTNQDLRENLETELRNYVSKLPKYSFAIWFKFKLDAPYFSKDDDEFYIIHNPILKETNFKVPMVRGSGWKGALARAFREVINENSNLGEKREAIESFLRIFGAGSETIKTMEDYIRNNELNSNFKTKLIEFVLFELGLEVSEEDLKAFKDPKALSKSDNLLEFIKKKLEEKINKMNPMIPLEFQAHRGRAIFYSTYFSQLSLEVINPHARRKRAGTQPIYYEVVPRETEGIFQLVYIPFDGILKPESELKGEAEEDLKNLLAAIEKLQVLGVGAKTKLGWGRFKILGKKFVLTEI